MRGNSLEIAGPGDSSHTAWIARGYRGALLPVIPPGAKLSPFSAVSPAQAGKVPGKPGPWGWHSGPWAEWTGADDAEIAEWQRRGAGVGMAGCQVPGLDLDLDDAGLTDELTDACARVLGRVWRRIGRSPRLLIPMRCTAPVAPWWMRWGPADATQMIDLRAAGRFWVADGTHPRTGRPYEWPDGRPRLDELPLLDEAVSADLREACRAVLARRGIVPQSGGRGWQSKNSPAAETDSDAPDQASLLAPSMELLEEALRHAPNHGSYDGWIRMGHAIKAAGGTVEMWAAWSRKWQEEEDEDLERRWAGFRPPFRVGWRDVEAAAREGGWIGGALHDFAAVAERGTGPAESGEAEAGDTDAGAAEAQRELFRRYVYVESLDRFLDLEGTDPAGGRPLLTRLALASRFPQLGRPTAVQKNAAALFLATRGPIRRVVQTVDYAPRAEPLFRDPDRGGALVGNLWTPAGLPPWEGTVTDEDVAPWLDVMHALFPGQELELRLSLDWMAWVARNEGVKPAFALLLGGHEGIGKDSALLPMLHVIGMPNVRVVTPEMLVSPQNDYLVGASVIVMPEVHTYQRRETMDRIKPLLAAPPERLSVNRKYVAQFEVRNLAAVVMTTNHPDALALTRDSRRVAVCWSKHPSVAGMDEASREAVAARFRALHGWYGADGRRGLRMVGAWLRQRDVSWFSGLSRAPMTEGMEAMIVETRGPVADAVVEWLEDWEGDLVSPADIAARIGAVGGRGKPVSGHAVARVLREMGAEQVTTTSVVVPPQATCTGSARVRLWALRDIEKYRRMPDAALARAFAKMAGVSAADIEKALRPTEMDAESLL